MAVGYSSVCRIADGTSRLFYRISGSFFWRKSSEKEQSRGIGLTSPRLHAIPAFILSTKTTIDTIQRGIFLGQHRPRYHLPPAFTSLYNNHQHSSSPLFSFSTFYKFAPDLASLCTSNNTTENQISTFISHSPLHQCHDAINTNIKHRLQSDFLQRLDKDSEHNIEEILDGKLGQGVL